MTSTMKTSIDSYLDSFAQSFVEAHYKPQTIMAESARNPEKCPYRALRPIKTKG